MYMNFYWNFRSMHNDKSRDIIWMTQMHTLASSLTSLWITQTDTELFDSLRVTMMPNMRDQKQQEWLRLKTVVCRCHDPSQHSMSVIVPHSTHTHTPTPPHFSSWDQTRGKHWCIQLFNQKCICFDLERT